MENWNDFKNLSISHGGVKTDVKIEDGHLITRKTWDAEPYLEAAAEARQMTDGQSWGDTRKVGVLPPAEFGEWMRIMREEGNDAAEKYIHAYFMDRPKLVHFGKYIKK
jgi:hypothetical protein